MVEATAALAVAGMLANAAYQAGADRQERGRIAADARAVLAIGVAYQAQACESNLATATVPVMAAGLRSAGAGVVEPVDGRRWSARFAGTRTATTVAAPLRQSGVRIRAELRTATDVERGVLRSMGGWVEGSTAVVAAARPGPGDMRVRRARLARGLTAAERAGGC